jgi:AcrR family transcriptional regulator
MNTPARSLAQRHDAILKAAIEVFSRDGFAQANVDEIAAKAGVAKPTIYNRFGDKMGLFAVALSKGTEEANARVENSIAAFDACSDQLPQQLLDLGMALVGCLTTEHGAAMMRLQAFAKSHLPDVSRNDRRKRHIDMLAGKLAQTHALGRLSLKDPQVAASQFMALVTTDALVASGFGQIPIPIEGAAPAVIAGVDTFLAAFSNQN